MEKQFIIMLDEKAAQLICTLTEFDNNDAPDIIWGDLHNEVEYLETELKGNFGL